jgi:hypothetical protein
VVDSGEGIVELIGAIAADVPGLAGLTDAAGLAFVVGPSDLVYLVGETVDH